MNKSPNAVVEYQAVSEARDVLMDTSKRAVYDVVWAGENPDLIRAEALRKQQEKQEEEARQRAEKQREEERESTNRKVAEQLEEKRRQRERDIARAAADKKAEEARIVEARKAEKKAEKARIEAAKRAKEEKEVAEHLAERNQKVKAWRERRKQKEKEKEKGETKENEDARQARKEKLRELWAALIHRHRDPTQEEMQVLVEIAKDVLRSNLTFLLLVGESIGALVKRYFWHADDPKEEDRKPGEASGEAFDDAKTRDGDTQTSEEGLDGFFGNGQTTEEANQTSKEGLARAYSPFGPRKIRGSAWGGGPYLFRTSPAEQGNVLGGLGDADVGKSWE